MSKANNGGPAFPVPGLQHDEDFNGMTLRDYFAIEFAQAIHASTTLALTSPEGRHVYTQPAHQTAQQAYALADAMLAAREA